MYFIEVWFVRSDIEKLRPNEKNIAGVLREVFPGERWSTSYSE